MKANDLRIGNYVKCDNLFCKIVNIYSEYIYCYDQFGEDFQNIEYIEPIELTEEVLVNLLGKPRTNGNKFDIYAIPTSGIEIQDRRKSALPTPTICIVKFGVHICDIKYLHQLQNTYYCITGKELEVEL